MRWLNLPQVISGGLGRIIKRGQSQPLPTSEEDAAEQVTDTFKTVSRKNTKNTLSFFWNYLLLHLLAGGYLTFCFICALTRISVPVGLPSSEQLCTTFFITLQVLLTSKKLLWTPVPLSCQLQSSGWVCSPWKALSPMLRWVSFKSPNEISNAMLSVLGRRISSYGIKN